MLRIEFEQNLAANEQAGMWWDWVEVGSYLRCWVLLGLLLFRCRKRSYFFLQSLSSLWEKELVLPDS